MAHIHIDENILSNICNEDLIAIIQELIHDELQKPETEIDSDFIEECVNAMLEIEQESDNSFVPLVPLVKRQDFVSRITGSKHGWRNLSKLARVAIVAATLTASTVTANAAVEAVTGINVIEMASDKVQDKLESWGVIPNRTGIEVVDGEDDDISSTQVTKTEASTQETTTVPVTEETTTLPYTEPETTTEPTTEATTATTKHTTKHNIEVVDGEDDDNDITTTRVTTTKQTTTNKYVPPTTQEAVTDAYKPENKVVLESLSAEYDSRFKTDYIYGEEISYEGMSLEALFSDGSRKPVSFDECSCTKGIDMNVTADYTLTVTYKGTTVSVDITVRPDEDTRGSRVCSNEDYDYLLTNEGAYITAYKGSNADITLNTVDGERVIAIAAGAFAESDIHSITGENLVKLFDNAFRGCTSLATVVAPNIKYIGNAAFEGCSSLERAVVSDSLTHIGSSAYKNSSIKEIIIPKGITEIPESLCENCDLLETVTIEGRVNRIREFAFCECTALENVSGTQYITVVEKNAFYDDTLVQLDTALPLLEEAGDYAFAFCNSIGFGALPENVNSIGVWSFAYCYGLTSAEINDSITIIPDSAFRGAHLSSIALPEGIIKIDDYAFMSTEIKEMRLPDSLREIGTYALYSLRLQRVYFGRNVESIGSYALYKTNRLTAYVYADTYPYEYADKNNIKYIILT